MASDPDRFDTAYKAFRDLFAGLYEIDTSQYSRGVTSASQLAISAADNPTWGLSKQIDRLLEGYCFQILATNHDPEAHNVKVIQTATQLTWILAEYLADTIAWLMRSILGHASKILFDNDTEPLLTPGFEILPLFRELLNSTSQPTQCGF